MLRAPQWMLRAQRTILVSGAFSAPAHISGENRILRWLSGLTRAEYRMSVRSPKGVCCMQAGIDCVKR
eukprot:304383-Prorocentrum_minimum.AAC.1